MKKVTYYTIDGDNNTFKTLRDAKHHIYVAYTAREAVKYLTGATITKVSGDNILTITPVQVSDEGRVTYGKTRRF